MPKIQLTCRYCGNPFERFPSTIAHGSSRYCSVPCRGKARRRQIPLVCPQCGKEFTTLKWRMEHSKTVYCSQICYMDSKRGKPLGEHVQVPCTQCGALLDKTPFYMKKFKRFFCNKTCQRTYEITHIGMSTHEKAIKISCYACGADKRITPYEFEHNKTGRFFCNEKCYESKIEVLCTYCGAIIQRKRSHAKRNAHSFCSSEHRTLYFKQEGHNRTSLCQHCQKEFIWIASRKRSHASFCTEWCYREAQQIPIIWEPSIADAAYIAGIIDGEGSMGINLSSRSGRGSARVTIVNTDKPVLEWIVSIFPTKVTFSYSHNSGPNKPCWVLAFSARNCLTLLNPLLPYLRIKKLQAEKVIEFQSMHRYERKEWSKHYNQLLKDINKGIVDKPK